MMRVQDLKVNVKRDDILRALKANRQAHVDEYDAAMEERFPGYLKYFGRFIANMESSNDVSHKRNVDGLPYFLSDEEKAFLENGTLSEEDQEEDPYGHRHRGDFNGWVPLEYLVEIGELPKGEYCIEVCW